MLWYLRTYLWFMLLAPGLLWLWRHWPRVMYVVPLVGVGLSAAGFLYRWSPMGESVVSVLTFLPCLLLGFAYAEGGLRHIPWWKVLAGGGLLCALGVAWAMRYPISDSPVPNVSDIPMATALYNLGFTLVLLRVPTRMEFINRSPAASAVVAFVNRRAMTIYLWGNVAIFLAIAGLSWGPLSRVVWGRPWEGLILFLAAQLVLLAIIVAVGWVEDLAARRPVALWPRTRREPAPPARPRRAIDAEPRPPQGLRP